MDGGFAWLRPGEPAPRTHVLRTVELNLVGKLAVLGSCVAGAGLGVTAGRVFALPTAGAALAGLLIPAAAVVALDLRRWRAMPTGYGWGGTAREVSDVAADLARRGIAAHVEMNRDGEGATLRYRNADAAAVLSVLAEHGVPPTPRL